MKIYWHLAWYFKAQWRRYSAAIFMLIGVATLEMATPFLTGRIVDSVVDQTITLNSLLLNVGLIAGIAFAVYFLRFLWRIFLFSCSFRLAEIMRQKIYRQLTLMAPEFFQTHRTGDLMARATNDITAVEMTAGEGVLSLVDGLLTGVVVLAIMVFLISWKLTLITLLPFPIMAWFFYRIGSQLHEGFRVAQERFSDLNDQVQESVSGIRMIRSFGREQQEDQQFLHAAERASEANLKVAATEALYDPAIFLTVGASFLLCVGGGGYLVTTEELTLGQLTSFTMYLGFLIWPMFAYGWLMNIVERGNAAYARIEQLLKMDSPVVDSGQVTELAEPSVSFTINEFQFPDLNQPVLKDLQIALPAGDTLGIVGHTGSGKTTLLNLLLRAFDGDQADVKIGGLPVSSYPLATLRSLVAVVPQDPFLFTATIAENIAMGKPGASLEEVRAVAELAAVDQDIIRFPEGYDTLVGERGVTLSGGQKQRIAIARALLLDAPILVLDDALSAVDVGTEKNILQHLNEARKGKTTIIVCHRLTAIEEADQIVVLSHGELIERGTHKSLVQQAGWYARMYDYQKLEQTVESGK